MPDRLRAAFNPARLGLYLSRCHRSGSLFLQVPAFRTWREIFMENKCFFYQHKIKLFWKDFPNSQNNKRIANSPGKATLSNILLRGKKNGWDGLPAAPTGQ